MSDFSQMWEMTNRLRDFPAETRPLVIDILEIVTEDAERRAKSRAPVRTGLYQSGIHGSPVIVRGAHGLLTHLEARAAHSSYIERGTSRMPPRPIITEAAAWAAKELEEALAMIAEDNL
jgi:hypothetical protein